jgi:hypothetical protein
VGYEKNLKNGIVNKISRKARKGAKVAIEVSIKTKQ